MKYRNDLKRRVLAGLFAGAALCLAAPAALAANSPIPNGTLPDGGHFIGGDAAGTITPNGTQMDIHQNNQNAVIVWDKGFNVGANATVNFTSDKNNFNTLNYDKSNSMSQIYGTINAQGGNIYIVNPSGVEIGNSAQINVGSLYVSNKKMNDAAFTDFINKAGNTNFVVQGTTQDAVLMSLGNINATDVTFEGNRIVIDADRIKTDEGQSVTPNIRTTNTGNVVIGYNAVQKKTENGKTTYDYSGQDKNYTVTEIDKQGNILNGNVSVNGYMWVENVEQLQAINTNPSGSYALRNSIDATATKEWNGGAGFASIGSTAAFTGTFDGLDYNIFNLNINRGTEENVGLFGVVGEGAVINNVTLVGGSITGKNNVGALAGSVQGKVQISNITNSASVTGASNVGGIVGKSVGGESVGTEENRTVYNGLINTGTITSSGTEDGEGGRISNAGGLIGYLEKGDLGGTSYNLGAVTGRTEADGTMTVGYSYNVGGLVGQAVNATLGDGTNLIYNRLNVTGAYNVGGIVGAMEGTTVQNAENSGNVLANGQVTGTYIYHTDHSSTDTNGDGLAEVEVYIANAGGIAGSAFGNSTITDVLNTGDVSSASGTFGEYVTNVNGGVPEWMTSTYYTAGNVGGIVGSAVDTNITDATNRENEVRGAHNVGGIAGYFANSENAQETDKYTIKYIVTNGVNDGGDIMATGARNETGFVSETIRSSGSEKFTIGNMGGIVGYMDGDNVYIAASANRGTVHTLEPEDARYVGSASKAANAGGIVGKIDRNKTLERGDGQSWEAALTSGGSNTKYDNAAVSNSYNTGDVMGYTGIGGIAGMMYKGEIAGSYNLGHLRTTRQSNTVDSGKIDPINMGGIVGDTTEESSARVLLYDVYNKGLIGDKNYDYFGRHVGGIVGRLSGTVEKAYNTGAIYNGYNVVGGIAGWMYAGSINNAFNTGNITVVNKNHSSMSQVGGIVGAADVSIGNITLSNIYNLGTLRSFWGNTDEDSHSSLGGIIGGVYRYFPENGQYKGDTVYIFNAYTTGNLYIDDSSGQIGSIYTNANGASFKVENTYYIQPDPQLKDTFTNLYVEDNPDTDLDNSNKAIAFNEKDDINQYKTNTGDSLFSNGTKQNEVNENDVWRIYYGSTPILNAFLPNAKDYFDNPNTSKNGISSIQYGTAYDPLLTIINAADGTANLTFDWQDLGINNDAGLAVYGAGLTLNDFMATGGSGYFGGLIYSDGALTLNAHLNGDTHDSANTNVTGDVALGSASQLYGSSVTIDADGQVTIYGSVTATGNGTTEGNDPAKDNSGSISIAGGSVDIYGQLTSAEENKKVFVPGIHGIAEDWTPGTVSDPHVSMSDIGDRFGYTTKASAVNGNISITANDAADGHVNVYYGNKGEGLVTTGGDLKVTASGDIYMDSDLDVGGNITFDAPGEKVLDLTNIGKVRGESFMEDITAALQQAGIVISNLEEMDDDGKAKAISAIKEMLHQKYGMEGDSIGQMPQDIVNTLTTEGVDGLAERVNVNRLHEFLDHFSTETGSGTIAFKNGDGSAADSSKITVDMWDYENNRFDLGQFDSDAQNGKFVDKISALNLSVAGNEGVADSASPRDYTYIWVSTGEQLAGIQQYYEQETNAGRTTNILGYNFALKNDINASGVNDYKAIASGEGEAYTGIFDGRDNRIVGLKVTGNNAGIFGTIGTRKDGEGKIHTGTVEDLRVYSSTFTGTENAGAVAGVNNGNISNVTTFGNVVQSANRAGGIAGTNSGTISGANAVGTSTVTAEGAGTVAGGIAGTNSGTISNSNSNSAVNASAGNATAIGGVAGVNAGTLTNVDSLGVTTGVYKGDTTQYSDNVGGIAGINQTGGTVENVYNESIVSGRDNVGGILGVNHAAVEEGKDSLVSNVANASSVTGEADSSSDTNDTSDYVGGLVGNNEGSITNGRNNGEITGNNYVGGLVGANRVGADDKAPELTNLVNDSAAAITGDNYVGGIAGSNEGTISANEQELINRGTITGQMYVGGVAGENTGTIANTHNDVELHVRYDVTETTPAKYFGGVAGINGHLNEDGTVSNPGIITSATNTNDIIAPEADYVGGIVGWNPEGATLNGMGNSNEGRVEGASHVGGVAGLNNAAITGSLNDMVGIENSGVVIAHNGGAGGIFGENTGKIEYVEMTNKGTVSGTYSENAGMNGTGGIFGVNSGAVTHSSLKNEVGGQVMGTQNVGGLIGQNSGDITGGRDENDGYYKYQIYNNGTIQAGTWNDDDKDGIVDEREFTAAAGDSENIAGLFGTNSGKVTAGYNTGVINAGGSSNVGGIAGTNAGTLDQVFNTVITADGKNQAITGYIHVGGIAGNNAGTISNAYNTTSVTGSTDTGAIAGNNAGSISNVYGFGSLVGNGSVSNGYNLSETGSWTHSSSYEGFDFDRTNADGTESIWKIYEGSTNPLLKVFLTKVTVNPDKLPDFAADGNEHKLNVGDLIQSGALTAPGGIEFGAFWQNQNLIQSNGHSAMGTYDDWLYSMQIAASGEGGTFNPNLLGYDIDLELGIGLPPDTVEPPVNEHWNFLFDDNPWDRNRDFRERKANIHFIAGGMTL